MLMFIHIRPTLAPRPCSGLTRTATQRTQEIKDIDLDADQRICFIEYLLIHYKAMILA